MIDFHKNAGPFSLTEIAEFIGAEFKGKEQEIIGIAPLDCATNKHISFLDNPKYAEQAKTTKASAVIINEKGADILPKNVIALVVKNPYFSYAKALQMFYPQQNSGKIHPTAVVEKSAKIGKNVSIGANCYIGENVEIAENTIISAGVVIQCSIIGKNCIIHPNAAIGQDGFGFARNGEEIAKIPQIGYVKIGDNVEIGAGTTIDRGALSPTIIGDNTKIDNQVQIAHNVQIGKNCQISGQTGIAGSVVIGNNVICGGGVGINGHIQITDNVMLSGKTTVTKSIVNSGIFGGFPALPIQEWRRNQAKLSRFFKKG